MSCCHQATSQYLSQCWPKSISPYGVTFSQYVSTWKPKRNNSHFAEDTFTIVIWIGICCVMYHDPVSWNFHGITKTRSNKTGVLCHIGYPFETHLKLKSRAISFVHNIRFNCPIGLKFCTEHGGDTAVPCAKIQSDRSTAAWVMGKRDFARFEFKMISDGYPILHEVPVLVYISSWHRTDDSHQVIVWICDGLVSRRIYTSLGFDPRCVNNIRTHTKGKEEHMLIYEKATKYVTTQVVLCTTPPDI